MRAPIRKPGKYTFIKQDPNLTEVKISELKKNLEKLKNIVRPKLAAEVKRLAAFGDFSENAEYQIAKGQLRGINQKMIDIDKHLKNAVIIDSPKNKDKIQIGHKVTVEINSKQKTFLILGSAETDPSQGIISHVSPIGSALIGRKVGETIKLNLASKEVVYKIIKIE